MQLTRMDGENEFQYHKRLVYGKLVDKTLADVDYSELSEYVYGQPYSSDVARRMFYGSCKTLQMMDVDAMRQAPQEILDELDQKMIELQISKQKMYDQRTAFNKVVRERARQEELHEILLQQVRDGNLPRLEYTPRECPASDNDLLVSLNDIHYGANVDNYWNTYNSEICKERMGRYLDRVLQIARLHGSENCVVWENGDAVSGSIHRSVQVTNKENVIEQVTGVSELIADFLVALSGRFRTVRFVSVAGNHSRLEPKKENALLGERLDDLIEWYLQARLQNFQNLAFGAYAKIDETMYLIDVRGKTYCGVHGDFDGTPAKIQALQTMSHRPLYAVLAGHKHHCKIDDVQGVKLIMAGSFLGMDDYCVQKRIYGGAEQLVCVCGEDGLVCSYPVPLG